MLSSRNTPKKFKQLLCQVNRLMNRQYEFIDEAYTFRTLEQISNVALKHTVEVNEFTKEFIIQLKCIGYLADMKVRSSLFPSFHRLLCDIANSFNLIILFLGSKELGGSTKLDKPSWLLYMPYSWNQSTGFECLFFQCYSISSKNRSRNVRRLYKRKERFFY